MTVTTTQTMTVKVTKEKVTAVTVAVTAVKAAITAVKATAVKVTVEKAKVNRKILNPFQFR